MEISVGHYRLERVWQETARFMEGNTGVIVRVASPKTVGVFLESWETRLEVAWES